MLACLTKLKFCEKDRSAVCPCWGTSRVDANQGCLSLAYRIMPGFILDKYWVKPGAIRMFTFLPN